MSTIDAPVVPMRFASTAPMAEHHHVGQRRVPDSEPFTSMPPAITKSAVSRRMNET